MDLDISWRIADQIHRLIMQRTILVGRMYAGDTTAMKAAAGLNVRIALLVHIMNDGIGNCSPWCYEANCDPRTHRS
jgi:hypothetical protein